MKNAFKGMFMCAFLINLFYLGSLSRDAVSHLRGSSPAFLILSNSKFKRQNYEKMRLRGCELLSLIPFPSIDWRLYSKCGKLRTCGLGLPQPRAAIEWTFHAGKREFRRPDSKETIKKGERQPIEWEKILANKATNKGLISKIHQQFMQLSIKKKKKSKNGQKI